MNECYRWTHGTGDRSVPPKRHPPATCPNGVGHVAPPRLRRSRHTAVHNALRTRQLTLARVGCEFDFRARRLGIRCGFKALGERTKRHAHTLRARLFDPGRALLALGAAAAAREADGGDGEVLPAALCARWLPNECQ